MTWPFENDTSAVVKRLAINSTKSDKRSRLFLLLTIALSVCMVFSILLISVGTQEAYKDTQRNKAQIAILGVTDQQSASLSENPDVSWVGEYSLIGFFYEGEKTISVAYGNEDYFLHQAEKTFQGNIFTAYGYALHIRDELVADAFASLPEQEQGILILYCVLELADGEIGSLVGMSRSAVQRHRTKALNELRKRLEDERRKPK